jgi:hypothetical protein
MRTIYIDGVVGIIIPIDYTYYFPTTYTSVK